jgi:hypothetical protein
MTCPVVETVLNIGLITEFNIMFTIAQSTRLVPVLTGKNGIVTLVNL